MQAKKYFITEFPKRIVFKTAQIARQHVENILESHQWKKITFSSSSEDTLLTKMVRSINVIVQALSLPGNAIVIFSYPIFPTYIKIFRQIILKRKSIRTIILLHDIDGIRNTDTAALHSDITLLSKHQYFISQTAAMSRWLCQIRPDAIIKELLFFDYLLPRLPHPVRLKSNTIIFAGQQDKSSFIKLLPLLTDLQFNIYGENINAPVTGGNIHHKGFFPNEELPFRLEGAFGLIWDGASITDCNGPFGNYLQINLPHKSSLYLLAQLPLIVHEDAAIAATVEQLHIGFTIRSLDEIYRKINTLTNEDYNSMVANTKSIADKISQGKYLSEALEWIDTKL